MNKSSISSLVSGVVLASTMALSAGTAQAGWSGNVALTTDYYFRGFTQNEHDPAIQGGFDYEHDSGFYAGVWASNVDENTFGGASIEIDTYLGYGSEFSNGIGWGIGYLRYNYPSTNNKSDTDEFHATLSYDFGPAAVGGTWYTSSDYFNLKGADVLELTVDVPLPAEFALAAAFRTTNFDTSPAKGGGDDYNDWSLGVSKEYGGIGFDLTYVDTSGVKGGCNTLCEDRLIFTVSKDL